MAATPTRKDLTLPLPDQQKWMDNASNFDELGFPRAIGVMDGKHFWCKQRPGTGSVFHNYKGYFSAVMLAVVDASCRFLLVDIGAAGRNSDSTLYMSSPIKSDAAGIPAGRQLGNFGEVPYIILADGGFGLSDYVMTPFPVPSTNTPERIRFNSRLSRPFLLYHLIADSCLCMLFSARRVVECALTSRFHLFQRIMSMSHKKVG